MRLKQLRGMTVVDPTTARTIGSVLDHQIDPVVGQLVAIDVGKPGGEAWRIPADRIQRVGAAAVMLTASSPTDELRPATIDDRYLDLASLNGLQVMGADGSRVGRLSDAAFNPNTLTIDWYVLRLGILGRLTRRRARILPTAIQSCSRELMLLSPSDVAPEPSASGVAGPPVALKIEDRLPAPSVDQVPDPQPAVARTR